MVTAEHEVDPGIWEMLLCPQARIDDAGMRASGKHGYTPAGHAGRDKALIHDQGIRRAVFAAEGMVAGEAGLIPRDPIDRTATEKEASADGMGIIAGDGLASGFRDVFERGFPREHDH